MPSTLPRPPWLYNETPYLQDLYRRNHAQIDATWAAWVAAHPEDANFGRGNQTLPSGGSVGYNPPSQQNFPGGNVPSYPNYGYDPFGYDPNNPFGQLAGNGNYYGEGQQGGQHWWDTFLGQAGINAGTNLLGGYLQDRSTSKANKANQKAIEDRIRAALAQLSPENIAALTRQFLPNIAALSNQQNQTQMQRLSLAAARQGLSNTPYALTAQAGMLGQQANNVSNAAYAQAMSLAGQRAGVLTGLPIQQTQPQMGLASAFSNTAQQTLLARALLNRQQPSGVPWRFAGTPGGPSPYDLQQTEGTPMQWPFYR